MVVPTAAGVDRPPNPRTLTPLQIDASSGASPVQSYFSPLSPTSTTTTTPMTSSLLPSGILTSPGILTNPTPATRPASAGPGAAPTAQFASSKNLLTTVAGGAGSVQSAGVAGSGVGMSGLSLAKAGLTATRPATADGSSSSGYTSSSSSSALNSSAPSSTVGSPPPPGLLVSNTSSESVATLTRQNSVPVPVSGTERGRSDSMLRSTVGAAGAGGDTRSSSPHCHFAPLPRVASVDASGNVITAGGASLSRSSSTNHSRSNSVSGPRVKVAGHQGEVDAIPFPLDLDSASTHLALPNTTSTSTILSPRPTTPVGTSTTTTMGFRSPSRSPSISRPPSAQSANSHVQLAQTLAGAGGAMAGGSLVSPPLSRKNSTDGVSLHYIEARRTVSSGGTSRERRSTVTIAPSSGEAAGTVPPTPVLNTSSTLGGQEKDIGAGPVEKEVEKEVLGFEALRRRESFAWKEERSSVHSHYRTAGLPPSSSTTTSNNTAPTTPQLPGSNSGSRSASFSNPSDPAATFTSAPITASPSRIRISAPVPGPVQGSTIRKTLFADPPAQVDDASSISGRCKPVLPAGSSAGGEKGVMAFREPAGEDYGVEDDDDDEEEEEEEEETREGEDDDDDEDDDEDDVEEENRDEENEEDDEDEEEEEEEDKVQRVTVRGAGVEVVHWHKEDEDEQESEPEGVVESSGLDKGEVETIMEEEPQEEEEVEGVVVTQH